MSEPHFPTIHECIACRKAALWPTWHSIDCVPCVDDSRPDNSPTIFDGKWTPDTIPEGLRIVAYQPRVRP
jgi:hypothetical protein